MKISQHITPYLLIAISSFLSSVDNVTAFSGTSRQSRSPYALSSGQFGAARTNERHVLHMSNTMTDAEDRLRQRDSSKLSALSISTDQSESLQSDGSLQNPDFSSLAAVLSCSLLITENTVGAGALVLPSLTAETGLLTASSIFSALYVLNLISGFLIAEVSINQYETSGSQAPSSFKDLADESLKNKDIGNIVSLISLLTNISIQTFALVRGGSIMSSALLGGAVDPALMSTSFALMLGVVCTVCSSTALSYVASGAVMVLFTSFAGLLLPGIANVQDPVATIFASGTSDSLFSAVSHAAPILYSSMIYQNIVPSVAKILSYDRSKTKSALVLGSLFPTLLYLGWCFASNGGGVTGAASGATLTAFSFATIWGSAMAGVMSIGEEFQSLFSDKSATASSGDEPLSLPSVVAAVLIPLAIGLSLSHGDGDSSGALSLAGGYGSPMLYGLLPVLMAFRQRREDGLAEPMVPGGDAVLGLLATATGGFIAQHFLADISGMFH
mmetsp:Transcript_26727/g.40976  ORF Transcript_26727/g.40976 Transcript_26727/m.40976 type:complete len:500 (+) Transcript_26727:31-1530(+)